MGRTIQEEKEIKLKILQDFYKNNEEYPFQNNERVDTALNTIDLTNTQLYQFEKYILENTPEDLQEEHFELLADIVFKDLKELLDKYSQLETQEEVEYFFERNRKVKNFKRHFEGLVKIDLESILEKLSNNDIQDISNPIEVIKQLGFSLENGKAPLEYSIELKINEFNSLDVDNIDRNKMIELFTKDSYEIGDDSFDNLISSFLGKIYQVEKTEINGWFIEVIKSDFDEFLDVLKNKDNNSVDMIQKELLNLINNRGLKVSGNEFVKPFEDRNEMKEQLTFNYASSGMADILYFPKNKNSKKLVANNISSWDNSEHSFSIFHHSYKAKQLNDLMGDLHEDAIVLKHISRDEELQDGISQLIKKDFNWSIEQIKEELSNGKSIEDIFDVDNIDFSAVVNTSKLTVFNQQKQYKKDNEEFILEEAQQVEDINSIIFSLSLIGEENQRFNSKTQSTEDIQKNRHMIEIRFSTINFGILSKKGKYTETSNKSIEDSIEEFLIFISKNYELFEKYNMNASKEDYIYDVKRFTQKAIEFIETYYPEVLVEHKDILNKKIFDLCVDEKIGIEQYSQEIEKLAAKDNEIEKLKLDLEKQSTKDDKIEDIRDLKTELFDMLDDMDDKGKRKSLKNIIKNCQTVEDTKILKNILNSIGNLDDMLDDEVVELQNFKSGIDDRQTQSSGRQP